MPVLRRCLVFVLGTAALEVGYIIACLDIVYGEIVQDMCYLPAHEEPTRYRGPSGRYCTTHASGWCRCPSGGQPIRVNEGCRLVGGIAIPVRTTYNRIPLHKPPQLRPIEPCAQLQKAAWVCDISPGGPVLVRVLRRAREGDLVAPGVQLVGVGDGCAVVYQTPRGANGRCVADASLFPQRNSYTTTLPLSPVTSETAMRLPSRLQQRTAPLVPAGS